MSRLVVNAQGKAVVARCGECEACQEWMLAPSSSPACSHILAMMPDGSIEHAVSTRAIERRVREWFRANMNVDALNVGTIEWRDGLSPR